MIRRKRRENEVARSRKSFHFVVPLGNKADGESTSARSNWERWTPVDSPTRCERNEWGVFSPSLVLLSGDCAEPIGVSSADVLSSASQPNKSKPIFGRPVRPLDDVRVQSVKETFSMTKFVADGLEGAGIDLIDDRKACDGMDRPAHVVPITTSFLRRSVHR